MAQNLCGPQSIYGSYQQTLFLGCSVLGFTASAGWNGQQSEITIELVKDDCVAEKEYWATTWPARQATPQIHNGADPGFTFPQIGAPAYFRVQNFEYAGLIQAWDEKEGSDGKPRYTVKLTDPRVILEHTQVILDYYEEQQYGIYNIFNVYGFLESRGLVCRAPIIGGVGTGAPALGVGGAIKTDRGIPWTLVKKALESLTAHTDGADPGGPSVPAGMPANIRYTRGGGLFYKGSTGNGWGELDPKNPAHSEDGETFHRYILDISELPLPQAAVANDYRITGPVASLTDIIDQVCQDAGCDYFVELLPVENELVIKVRVVNRTSAIFPLAAAANPAITNFINQFDYNAGADGRGIIADAIGRELRPEVNSTLLIGGKARQYYEVTKDIEQEFTEENVGIGGNLAKVGRPRTNPYNITPFWGYDSDGVMLQSKDWKNPNLYYVSNPIRQFGWQDRLDFRKINLALFYPINLDLEENAFGWVWENELRWALGDLATFRNMILRPFYPDTVLRRYWRETLGAKANDVRRPNAGFSVEPTVVIDPPYGSDNPAGGSPSNRRARDEKTMFNWLSSYASDVYGKQFLVQAPYLCEAPNPDAPDNAVFPFDSIFTDLPSTEGGWPSQMSRDADGNNIFSDATKVLGIDNPSREGDFFRDDLGKWSPILKFEGPSPDKTGLNTQALNIDEYLASSGCVFPWKGVPFAEPVPETGRMCVWVKATVEPQWVSGCPVVGVDPTHSTRSAHLKISAPVTTGDAQWSFASKVTDVVNSGGPTSVSPNVTAPMSGVLGFPHETAGTTAPGAVWPMGAGVPIVSNTRTYGPWRAIGKNPGAVNCEVDEGFAPWEYGSIASMNKAAAAKVVDSATSMQVVERGQVTVPGYPEVSLGAALYLNPPVPLFYHARVLSLGTHQYPDAAPNLQQEMYNYVDLLPVGQPLLINVIPLGVNISNINVNVGTQGVTTSYTVNSFTPVFGRFSRGNAERLKKLGLERHRASRERRAQASLQRLLKIAENRASLARAASEPEGPLNQHSPNIAIAGQLVKKYDYKRKIVMGVTKNTMVNYGDYDKTSIMPYDGFFRPVSNYGGAQELGEDQILPKITANSGAGAAAVGPDSSLGLRANQPLLSQTVPPTPPLSGCTRLPITAKYLDFLADPVSNPTLLDSERANSSTSGHDVEGVARKSLTWLSGNQPDGANSMLFFQTGTNPTSYADDYRYMAMRGPLVMQSWGYDVEGYPIPNSKIDPESSQWYVDGSGGFANSYAHLNHEFRSDWLSDARNWPVAPIDLRFDRYRGVWTIPPAPSLTFVNIQRGGYNNVFDQTGVLPAEGSGIALSNLEGPGDTSCPAPGHILVRNRFPYPISGDIYAYYHSQDNVYWAIPGPSGDRDRGVKIANKGCLGATPDPEIKDEPLGNITIGCGLNLTQDKSGGELVPGHFTVEGQMWQTSTCPDGTAAGSPRSYANIRLGKGLFFGDSAASPDSIVLYGPTYAADRWVGDPIEGPGGQVTTNNYSRDTDQIIHFNFKSPLYCKTANDGCTVDVHVERPTVQGPPDPPGGGGGGGGGGDDLRLVSPPDPPQIIGQLNFGEGFVIRENTSAADSDSGGGEYTVYSTATSNSLSIGTIGSNKISNINLAKGGESDGSSEGNNVNSPQNKLGPIKALSSTTRATRGLATDTSVVLGTVGYEGEVEVMTSVACVDGELKYYQKKLVFSGGLLQSVSEAY